MILWEAGLSVPRWLGYRLDVILSIIDEFLNISLRNAALSGPRCLSYSVVGIFCSPDQLLKISLSKSLCEPTAIEIGQPGRLIFWNCLLK